MKDAGKGEEQLTWEDCVRRGMRRSGRTKDGENYGKREQKEWLNNTLPDPHPCTAGRKSTRVLLTYNRNVFSNFVGKRFVHTISTYQIFIHVAFDHILKVVDVC